MVGGSAGYGFLEGHPGAPLCVQELQQVADAPKIKSGDGEGLEILNGSRKLTQIASSSTQLTTKTF